MCVVAADRPAASPASRLDAAARQQLALDALSGRPISALAQGRLVSRKFVYQQLRRAGQGLDLAFDPPDEPDDLLFWLPVTRPWLRQLVLALALVCHSPYRGIRELLADLFDHDISIGTVHNILAQAAASPVLAAADARSGYCCLLSQEEHRDPDAWGVRLLGLRERGFAPEATIADFGTGLRAGVKVALPAVPCRADIFHPLRDLVALSTYLDNRAYDAISCHEGLLRKQTRHARRHVWKNRCVARKAVLAGRAVGPAVALADEVRTLLTWWHKDILAVAADECATRCTPHDWVVEELRTRETRCERIRAVRVLPENHRDELLMFAERLDADLAELARRFEVSVPLLREALAVAQLDESRPSRWRREEELWSRPGGKYALLRVEVEKLARGVARASGVIENLNSRPRNYFFLRKQLGNSYLKLLQFYLNRHRFERSERQGGEGKSPRELLTGQGHGHWLELLGYQRFRQAA